VGVPADHPQPPQPTQRGERLPFTLSPALAEALSQLCRREGVTMFMVLGAALKTLLYRYTGEEDLVVGGHIANRNRAEIEGAIGFFVNLLLLRSDLSGKPTFLDLVRRLRQTTMDAYAHQDLPYERLVEELQPRRDLSRDPLFEVAFNFTGRAAGPAAAGEGSRGPLAVSVVEPEETLVRFKLVLAMTHVAGGSLRGSWEYSADLYDGSTIARLQDRFVRLLEGIAADPESRLDDLPMLTEEEAALQARAAKVSRATAYERFKTTRPQKVKAG